MEPVVDAAAHDDHAAAVRLDRVVRKLARRMDDEFRRDARVLLLPRGRIGRVVLIGAGALAAETAVDRIVRKREVVDRRHEHLAVRRLDAAYGERARKRPLCAVVAEIRQLDLDRIRAIVPHGETRANLRTRVAVLFFDIPFFLRAPTLGERPVRDDDLAGFVVDDVVAEVRVLFIAPHVARAEHTPGNVAAVSLLDAHEKREIRILACILEKERHRFIDIVFLQDHMPHRHRHRGVAADLQRDPCVGKHRRLGIVRRDGNDLRPFIAYLRHEMGVRRPRQRHVRAPCDEIARVVPVARLRHIRLLAPDLRTRGRQIGVPVGVERKPHTAHELHEANARRIAQHGHRRDDREPEDAVGAVGVRRIEYRGRDQLRDFFPRCAHKAAHPAGFLIFLLLHRIGGDALPRVERRLVLGARLAPQRCEFAAHIGIFYAMRAIQIPRERRPARTAARLKIRHIRRGLRIVRRLVLPGDDAVLHMHIPAARAGTVHAVRRSDSLVERPAVAVHVLPVPSALVHLLMPVCGYRCGDKILELLKNTMHPKALLKFCGYRQR